MERDYRAATCLAESGPRVIAVAGVPVNLIHQSRCPSIRTSKLEIVLESWAEFAANQTKPGSDA
jgi:hypothetical protein